MTFAPTTASVTGYASNVTGAIFTLTATSATDGYAHKVTIHNDAATDHSGKTVTLVGTNSDGKALTESVTGPAGTATVTSTGYFTTLTSATPSATIGADTFDIGFSDALSSITYPLNWRASAPCTLSVDISGTINFTVQQCFQNVSAGETAIWESISALTSKTADTQSEAYVGAMAIRVITNTYSAGATLSLYSVQPDTY
jgi:hypothetical protein